MRQLHTEIEIAAGIDVVWKILADIERYPEWNPLIPNARGSVATDQILDIQIQTPGTAPAPYRVRVIEVTAPRRLVWLGHFHVPFLIDGLHTLELIPLPNGKTRVLHHEQFRGLLVPFVWKSFLTRELGAGFVAHNQSLKQRVESLAAVAA